MSESDKVMICVRVPIKTRDQLSDIAERNGTTLSAQVNIALFEYVEKFREKGMRDNA